MSRRILKLIGLTVLSVITIVACRPKQRPMKIKGKRPTVTVSIVGMADFGADNHVFTLTGCEEVKGDILKEQKAVTFTHRNLKKGMAGCTVQVGSTQPPTDIVYTASQGALWTSETFSVSQNETGALVAEAVMSKTYKSSFPEATPNLFELYAALQLPAGTDIKKFDSFTGQLKCSHSEESINLIELEVREDLTAALIFPDQEMSGPGDIIVCTEIAVTGIMGENHVRYSAVIPGDVGTFTPVAHARTSLNNENPFKLVLVPGVKPGIGGDNPTSNSINVSVNSCPLNRIDLATNTCACPTERPLYDSIKNICVVPPAVDTVAVD